MPLEGHKGALCTVTEAIWDSPPASDPPPASAPRKPSPVPKSQVAHARARLAAQKVRQAAAKASAAAFKETRQAKLRGAAKLMRRLTPLLASAVQQSTA